MLKLKKGNKIKLKNGGEYTVSIVADGGYYLKLTGDLEIGDIYLGNAWFTDSEIEANFILPKEKWAPDYNDTVFYPRIDSTGIEVTALYWNNSTHDNYMLDEGLLFRTEAEAQKVVEEIKKILNK